jgi:hypothetical protein
MRYILIPGLEGIQYGRYVSYLKSVKGKIPAHVYEFAISEKHFTLNSPNSLHDSWLETAQIKEVNCDGQSVERRRIDAQLVFLGQTHDRRIILDYTDISYYVFHAPDRRGDARFENVVAHGNCFTHEITLGHANTLIHEFLFEREAASLSSAKIYAIARSYLVLRLEKISNDRGSTLQCSR